MIEASGVGRAIDQLCDLTSVVLLPDVQLVDELTLNVTDHGK